MVEGQLRRSGIKLLGDVPWGTHVCLFYETPQDLIDTQADYFSAALEDGECCIWAVSEPVDRDTAVRGLRKHLKGFDGYLSTGQMEIVPGHAWYLRGDEFDPQQITGGWHAKLRDARARGFSGLRVSGNAFWLESNMWPTFQAYEEELDRSVKRWKMIVLCTYSLQAARAVDILDVARTHQYTIARRAGRWDFLETPELALAKKKIKRLNAAIDAFAKPGERLRALTPRERVVLAQIIKGVSAKEAAFDLSISPRTVEFHRANIMRKLGVRNVAALLGKVLGNR
jgi:DNA-binding CsgD family transcriptional regulator